MTKQDIRLFDDMFMACEILRYFKRI